MSAGIPTIVSGLGSAAELPDSAVVKVPRNVTAEALAEQIVALLRDSERRSRLGSTATEVARQNSFDRVARILFERYIQPVGRSRAA
jgi:glycosyltransferase involved in cell wall biosynthesis